MKYWLLLFTSFLFIHCSTKDRREKEIENIPMVIQVDRFDKEFSAAEPPDLDALKEKYPFFFPVQFHDTIWEQKMQDTLQQQLNKAVADTFPSEDNLKDELRPLFQHIKYYFPEFKAPTIVTTTSDVDYRNNVIIADSLLILSLDTYLGSDHPFYAGIKKYISQNMKPSQLAPNVAAEYARQLIVKPRQRSLLAQMIYYGKELYLKDVWLPVISDAEKIGYTEEQMKWAQENESEMWRYFVERELLYSTSPKLQGRFINPAPFSKFYLEIDNESPGMIGRYLGWQIVRSYMENNAVTVKQLMIKNPDDLFKESKYKPAK